MILLLFFIDDQRERKKKKDLFTVDQQEKKSFERVPMAKITEDNTFEDNKDNNQMKPQVLQE